MRILQKEKLRAQQHEMEQSKTLNKAKSSEVSFAQGSLASSVSALASVVIVGKAKSKCVEILSFRDWQCSRAGRLKANVKGPHSCLQTLGSMQTWGEREIQAAIGSVRNFPMLPKHRFKAKEPKLIGNPAVDSSF